MKVDLYKVYLPLFFILLQSKDYVIYYLALQNAINASDWKLEAKSTNSDFEMGLQKAISEQFPPPPEDNPQAVLYDGCLNYGCDFHFVQANLRYMISDCYIPKDESYRMVKGPDALFKILSTELVNKIESKGMYDHY